VGNQVFATVSFSDGRGIPKSQTVKPKDIWIKCPLVTPQHATVDQVLVWKKQLLNGSSSIEYSNIPDSQAFKIALDQVSALDLSEINMDEQIKSAVFSGIAKVTNDRMIIEIKILQQKINLNVWTGDLKQATGFLAYIRNIIKMAIDNAQQFQVKAEKVGHDILDSFEIGQRISDLIICCETKSNINDLIILLGEIGARFQRSFPNMSYVEDISEWRERFTDEYRPGDVIKFTEAIKLQKNALNWFQKIVDIMSSNADIYETTFTDQKVPVSQIKGKIEGLKQEVHEKEIGYSNKIFRN